MRISDWSSDVCSSDLRVLVGQRLDDLLALPGPARARRDGHALAAFDVEIETSRGARVRVDYLEALIADHAGWRVITLHHAATPRAMGVSPGRDAGARAAVGAAAMLAQIGRASCREHVGQAV